MITSTIIFLWSFVSFLLRDQFRPFCDNFLLNSSYGVFFCFLPFLGNRGNCMFTGFFIPYVNHCHKHTKYKHD